jgi:hypothetical protein
LINAPAHEDAHQITGTDSRSRQMRRNGLTSAIELREGNPLRPPFPQALDDSRALRTIAYCGVESVKD